MVKEHIQKSRGLAKDTLGFGFFCDMYSMSQTLSFAPTSKVVHWAAVGVEEHRLGKGLPAASPLQQEPRQGKSEE